MKLKTKNILLPAIILSVICFCATALLGVTNELTKGPIATAQKETVKKSRLIVLSEADSFEEVDDNTAMAYKGEDLVGYVFVTESSGYAGKVRVMTGIDMNKNITGIVVLEQSETPGLGANCTKSEFAEQFMQKANELVVVKNEDANEGEIEALTGATITSKAVTLAVNEAVVMYENIVGGETNG